jgi:hypothetical protein
MKRLLFPIPIALLLTGCFGMSRTQSTSLDRITFQAQLPLMTAEGIRIVPISGSLRRVGTTEAETHTGPDTEAITSAVLQGISGMGSLAGGFPWAQMVGGIGASVTAAATGYLCLKKREQMKRPQKEL